MLDGKSFAQGIGALLEKPPLPPYPPPLPPPPPPTGTANKILVLLRGRRLEPEALKFRVRVEGLGFWDPKALEPQSLKPKTHKAEGYDSRDPELKNPEP